MLHPLKMEEGSDPPFLKNKELYFIVRFPGSPEHALVEIPSSSLPRFIELPSSKEDAFPITFLDEIVRQTYLPCSTGQ